MVIASADAAGVVAAVAAVMQAVILAVAAVYGFIQFAELRRTRRVSAVMPIFERLHSSEASERRRQLYQEITPAMPDISPAEQRIVEEIIAEFYFVGYLVDKHLLEFHLVADLYYGTVVRCWEACQGFVEQERVRRGTQYASYFEAFYWRCLEYGRIYHAGESVHTYRTITGDQSEIATADDT